MACLRTVDRSTPAPAGRPPACQLLPSAAVLADCVSPRTFSFRHHFEAGAQQASRIAELYVATALLLARCCADLSHPRLDHNRQAYNTICIALKVSATGCKYDTLEGENARRANVAQVWGCVKTGARKDGFCRGSVPLQQLGLSASWAVRCDFGSKLRPLLATDVCAPLKRKDASTRGQRVRPWSMHSAAGSHLR